MRLHKLSRVALLAGVLPAMAAPQDTKSTVRAQGSGMVSVKPDEVTVNIGVVNQGQTAEAVGATNAKQLTETMAELKKILPKTAELKTVNYSLNPQYRYGKEGGSPTITGYQASNTIQVKMQDVDLVGKLIDTAAKGGSNNIQSVQFSVQDEQKVRGQALRLAAVEARKNAEAMAAALGLKVTRVLHVEDSQPGGPIRPMMAEMSMMARADKAPTPVEPGTLEVRAAVTVTLEVAPQ